MSHEHEAVYLAVAAFDFELSPDERRRMEAGLAECRECAEIAASHGDLARLLDRLPVHDASPQVRQRIMRAALVPPRQTPVAGPARRGGPARLGDRGGRGRGRVPRPAAARSQRRPSAGVAPGTRRRRLATPSSSPEPGSSESDPDPASARRWRRTPSPRSFPAGCGSGRRRASPTTRSSTSRLLDVGDRLLILDGPVVANDYEWYEVMAWRPGNLYASWPVGWVARGDHDGTPWIAAEVDACPNGTITMRVVAALHPQERVACFGDRPLTLRAYVTGVPRAIPARPRRMSPAPMAPRGSPIGRMVAGPTR